MSTILKFDFQKKRTIKFFRSKLSKLHKKDPILHVATTFSLKQGGNKNKPWTHSTPLNDMEIDFLFFFCETHYRE